MVTTLPVVRKDTLPENTKYPDIGCDVISSPCIACPLLVCLEDLPVNWFLDEQRKHRDADIVRLRKRGMRVTKIASKHGVSVRTVHRVCTKEKAK